jgi:hypothetical protein
MFKKENKEKEEIAKEIQRRGDIIKRIDALFDRKFKDFPKFNGEIKDYFSTKVLTNEDIIKVHEFTQINSLEPQTQKIKGKVISISKLSKNKNFEYQLLPLTFPLRLNQSEVNEKVLKHELPPSGEDVSYPNFKSIMRTPKRNIFGKIKRWEETEQEKVTLIFSDEITKYVASLFTNQKLESEPEGISKVAFKSITQQVATTDTEFRKRYG